MTPAEIAAARKRLGLTQALFAARLGVSRRTVEEWENPRGKGRPAPYFGRALRDLERELDESRHMTSPSTAQTTAS
jgi:DNA-binding transcriptional regulator YiaG